MFASPHNIKDIKYTYLLTHRDKLGSIELGNNTLQDLQSTDRTNNQTHVRGKVCIRSLVQTVS